MLKVPGVSKPRVGVGNGDIGGRGSNVRGGSRSMTRAEVGTYSSRRERSAHSCSLHRHSGRNGSVSTERLQRARQLAHQGAANNSVRRILNRGDRDRIDDDGRECGGKVSSK